MCVIGWVAGSGRRFAHWSFKLGRDECVSGILVRVGLTRGSGIIIKIMLLFLIIIIMILIII